MSPQRRDAVPNRHTKESPAEQSQQRDSLRDFILGLLHITSDGLNTFSVVRSVCCEPFSAGPVERALREALQQLSRLRVCVELGTKSRQEVVSDVVPILDLVSRATSEIRGPLAAPLARWMPSDPFPVFAMVTPTLPPIPEPLPPEATGIIEQIMALIRELLERGTLQGDVADEIRILLAQLEELLASGAQSGAILARLRQLLSLLFRALGALLETENPTVIEAIINALKGLLGRLAPLLGRAFVFLGPLLWLLFAAQVGYAAGTELSKINVNDKETLGQWWGNRLWELLKGPCPELLEALNLAILRWRTLQRIGASDQDVADALARVLVLESEYIRRCLALGTTERSNEEQFKRSLEEEYRRLQGRIHGTSAVAGETCHVTVTLDRVVYDGADLGDTWKYSTFVQGSQTDFPEHTLMKNGSEVPGRLVFTGGIGGCPGVNPLTITVESTSVGLIYNSVGAGSRLIQVACPGQQTETIVVRVRDGSDVADLTFTFTIAAACVDTGSTSVIP